MQILLPNADACFFLQFPDGSLDQCLLWFNLSTKTCVPSFAKTLLLESQKNLFRRISLHQKNKCCLSHRSKTNSRRPALQFDDIPLWVGDIGKSNRSCTWDRQGHHLPHNTTPGCQHRFPRSLYVVHGKGDMRKAWAVYRPLWLSLLGVVFKDLQRGTPCAMPGQAQVYALDMSLDHTGAIV